MRKVIELVSPAVAAHRKTRRRFFYFPVCVKNFIQKFAHFKKGLIFVSLFNSITTKSNDMKKITKSQKQKFAAIAEKMEKLEADFFRLMKETGDANNNGNANFAYYRVSAAVSIVKTISEQI